MHLIMSPTSTNDMFCFFKAEELDAGVCSWQRNEVWVAAIRVTGPACIWDCTILFCFKLHSRKPGGRAVRTAAVPSGSQTGEFLGSYSTSYWLVLGKNVPCLVVFSTEPSWIMCLVTPASFCVVSVKREEEWCNGFTHCYPRLSGRSAPDRRPTGLQNRSRRGGEENAPCSYQ